MGQAPKGQTSLSGQTGGGATDNAAKPIIRVLGERHTGTRAMAAMIEALPHLSELHPLPTDRSANKMIKLLKQAAAIEQAKLGGNAMQSVMRDVVSLAKPRAACWKHAMLEWDDSFTALSGAVLTQRNPYAWIVALFARPYHHVGRRQHDIETFVTTPWLTIPRERMDAAVATPAALWNAKQAGAHSFANQANIPTTFVSFEPFLANPVAILGAALQELGQSGDGLAPLPLGTKTKEPIAIVQSRHATEPWRNWLTAGQVAAMNDHLDPAVMRLAGYSIENPDDFATSLTADHCEGLHAYVQLRVAKNKESHRE